VQNLLGTQHSDTFTYLLPHHYSYLTTISMYATTISIPTKTEDNCSYASILPNGQQESKFDAFQYYSSDLLRLKTLRLSSNHDDDELSVLARVNDILRSAGLSDITAKNNASKDKRDLKRRRVDNSEPTYQEAE
jgi:hypothetical protein